MKKALSSFIVIFISFLFNVKLLYGEYKIYKSPSLYGQQGLLRVLSAKRMPPNTKGFATSAHFAYVNQKNFIPVGNSYEDVLKLSAILGFSYSPFDFLELAFGSDGFSNLAGSSDTIIQQLGNFRTSTKIGYDFGRLLALSLFGEFDFKSRVADLDIRKRATALTGGVLATFDLALAYDKPFRIHINGGYRLDNSDEVTGSYRLDKYELFMLNILPYNQIVYGVGGEWLFSYISLLGEISGAYAMNSGESFIYHPLRLSLGVKIFPAFNSSCSFEFMGDLGIIKSPSEELLPVPDITIYAGTTFRFDGVGKYTEEKYVAPSPPPPKETKRDRFISGIISDDTGKDLLVGVSITIIDQKGVSANIKVEDKNGSFKIEELLPEKYQVKFEKNGYIPSSIPVDLKGNSLKDLTINLKKEVLDKVDKVQIKTDKIILPLPILFEIDKMESTTESIGVLELFARFLKDSPYIKEILVEGYSDSIGNPEINLKISLERANWVKEKLISFGVEESRLKINGIGQENPIASNETDEGRMQNRRVEFRILKIEVKESEKKEKVLDESIVEPKEKQREEIKKEPVEKPE